MNRLTEFPRSVLQWQKTISNRYIIQTLACDNDPVRKEISYLPRSLTREDDYFESDTTSTNFLLEYRFVSDHSKSHRDFEVAHGYY